MNELNSFKLLGQQEESQHSPPPELKEQVKQQLDLMSLVGLTVDTFLPGALNMFVDMLGGKVPEDNDIASLDARLGDRTSDEESAV